MAGSSTRNTLDVTLNLRVDQLERQALDMLRAEREAALERDGVIAQVSLNSLMRTLIREAAKARLGAWPPPAPTR